MMMESIVLINDVLTKESIVLTNDDASIVLINDDGKHCSDQ